MIIIETRICTKCGVEKPFNDKYFNKIKSKSGYNTKCRICVKEYYQNNKTKISERERIYRESHKESIAKRLSEYYQLNKEYKKIYYLENIEIKKEHNALYYANNKERVYKCNKEYRKNNRAKTNILHQKRRSMKKQLPHTLTFTQWENVKIYFNNKCAYCGLEKPLTQEHFIPVAKSGEYTLNNIIPSCRSCNSSKGKKEFSEWYQQYKHYSKKRETIILKYLHYNKQNNQQLAFI